MLTKEWRTVDRSKWRPGPWDDEPDKKQWQDATTGLPCLIVRHPRYGHLCGYVGVPPTHPLHGADYSSAHNAVEALEVHGGLTFAAPCSPEEAEGHGICHIKEPGEPDVWWFGFDCAHLGDRAPKGSARDEFADPESAYRTVEYVAAECARLAAQLKETK